MSLLWTALLLGLMGSVHCLGMCGPIALALPVGGLSTGGRVAAGALHQIGRVLTYAILGALFGLVGKGLAFAGFQQWVSIVMGIAMILTVLWPAFMGKTSQAFQPLTRLSIALKKPMGAFLRKKKMSSFFVLGLLNGLLPCGLVYVALGASLVMSSFVEGALYMAFFGLGTAPAMFAAVVAGSYISTAFRLKLQKLVPVALFVIGSLFVLRGLGLGIPFLSPPQTALQIEATESCCSKTAASESPTCTTAK